MHWLAINTNICMKQTTVGVFEERDKAEKAIQLVHRKLQVPTDDITFLYRNPEGKLREVDVDMIEGKGAGTGAWTGVIVGLLIGALFGAAIIAGLLPTIENFFTEGAVARFFSALNLSTTLGTIGLTALTGALLGSLLGGVFAGSRTLSMRAMDMPAKAREILVAVNAPESMDIHSLFRNLGAFDTRIYRLSI